MLRLIVFLLLLFIEINERKFVNELKRMTRDKREKQERGNLTRVRITFSRTIIPFIPSFHTPARA